MVTDEGLALVPTLNAICEQGSDFFELSLYAGQIGDAFFGHRVEIARDQTVEEFEQFFHWLPDEVAIDEDRRVDFKTVNRFAALVAVGEWTTYRELSIAATGRPSASMAVGGHVRKNDFSNAHRVLNHSGRVVGDEQPDSSGGRQERQELLVAEGVLFNDSGIADPSRFVTGEELLRRATAGVTFE